MRTTTNERLTVSLANFTSPRLIVPELQARTTTGVVNELNQVLHFHEGLPEHLFAKPAVINRELLTSMKLDGGLVIAQVRLSTLPNTRFALGRAKEPLPWRASNLKPLDFVALVVEPSGKADEYKRVVAALNALAGHAEALKLLREAASAEEMLGVLQGVTFHVG
jgi:mannitol/fructose-specific phosphotransferase system IIA component (Ntr-type)